MAKRKQNPDWDVVIRELGELADTLNSGGIEAVKKKYRYTSPEEVAAMVNRHRLERIREKLDADPTAFAALLGVSPQTVQAWEAGTKKPVRVAQRFLEEIERDPKYWRRRLKERVALSA